MANTYLHNCMMMHRAITLRFGRLFDLPNWSTKKSCSV